MYIPSVASIHPRERSIRCFKCRAIAGYLGSIPMSLLSPAVGRIPVPTRGDISSSLEKEKQEADKNISSSVAEQINNA